VPRILGFELMERAGQGGMADVFRARRTIPLPGGIGPRSVVVKMVPDSRPEWLASLEHEMEVLLHIKQVQTLYQPAAPDARIAHIQPVSVNRDEEIYCAKGEVEGWADPNPARRTCTLIVVDDIWGPCLTDYLKIRRLSVHECVLLGERLAALLGTLHTAAHILHNDLRPENIIIRPPFRVGLVDFGVSLPLNDGLAVDHLPHSMAYFGVRPYMAPEKRAPRDEPVSGRLDWRSDLWSLGAILLYALGGAAELTRKAEVLAGFRHPVPEPLERFLRRALQFRPSDRHESWQDVQHEISACREQIPLGYGQRTGWFSRLSASLRRGTSS